MATSSADKDKDKDEFTITIDRGEFQVRVRTMTGAQLRQLPQPPIGPERDLFLEKPGAVEDQKIDDSEVVKLKDDMHFYTGPGKINPG